MRLWCLLVSLGLALAQQPDYSFARSIFSLQDIRLEKTTSGALPLLEVIAVEPLREWQQNRTECQQARIQNRSPKASCPKFEWTVPFSPLSESQAAAQDLRKAWQRFEDRYWWRVEVELNNPLKYLAYCELDYGQRLDPPKPEVKIHVPKNILPAKFG
jgi:hypothetical protein